MTVYSITHAFIGATTDVDPSDPTSVREFVDSFDPDTDEWRADMNRLVVLLGEHGVDHPEIRALCREYDLEDPVVSPVRSVTLTDEFTSTATLTVGSEGREWLLQVHLVDVDGAEIRLDLDVLTTRAATLDLATMTEPSESLDIEAWDGVQFAPVDTEINEDGRPMTRMFLSTEYPNEDGDGLTFWPYTDELDAALDALLGPRERILARHVDADGYRLIAHRLGDGTVRLEADAPTSTHVSVDLDGAALEAFARGLLPR